jgi:hypothetical protein
MSCLIAVDCQQCEKTFQFFLTSFKIHSPDEKLNFFSGGQKSRFPYIP